MRLRCKSIIFVALVLLFCVAAPPGFSIEIPAMPANPVVDLAGIIDEAVENKINRYLKELEGQTTAQMAILTVKSLDGQSIEDFSLTIAHDKWKLGQKGKDNGVLLTVALNDRKYRIEVGYGLEGALPDSLVGDIGRQYLVPNFRKGDYSTGVYEASLVIANKIAADAGVTISAMPKLRVSKPEKKAVPAAGPFGKIISLVFFLIMVFVFIKNPRFFLALLLLSSIGGRRGPWGGSGGGFCGGGFGGGGFGGGGGGFGGGGASGGW